MEPYNGKGGGGGGTPIHGVDRYVLPDSFLPLLALCSWCDPYLYQLKSRKNENENDHSLFLKFKCVN